MKKRNRILILSRENEPAQEKFILQYLKCQSVVTTSRWWILDPLAPAGKCFEG